MKQHLGSGIGIDSRREQISLPQGQTPRQVRIAREALPRAAAPGHQLVGACGVRIRRPGCPVHIPVDRIQCCLRPRVRFRREFPAATQGVFRQAAAGRSQPHASYAPVQGVFKHRPDAHRQYVRLWAFISGAHGTCPAFRAGQHGA